MRFSFKIPIALYTIQAYLLLCTTSACTQFVVKLPCILNASYSISHLQVVFGKK